MRRTSLVIFAAAAAVVAFAGCNSGNEAESFCKPNQLLEKGQCLDDIGVAVNGEGFLPERRKTAVFLGDSAGFELVNKDSGEVAFEGDAAGPVLAPDTKQMVYWADFSSVDAPGTYFIRTASGKVSDDFKIGDDVLSRSLDGAMLGLYGQRCGEAVTLEFDGQTFKHNPCHRKEALLERLGEEGTRDDTGGWHDAGDYGKYVRNGAFAVAFLMKAYEHFPDFLEKRTFAIPEKGGDTPDMLDESRFELEWILKTQFSDGSFSHKVTALSFEANLMPDSDTQDRYFFTTSTTSTADAVAVLALAGRLYETFDSAFAKKCLTAAEQGQKFLDENPDEIQSNQEGAVTGTYGSTGDKDERLWALAELWETTGDAKYLAPLEALAADLPVSHNFDWSEARNLGILAYIESKREGRNEALVEEKAREFVLTADDIAAHSVADPYARGFNSYFWGSNGVIVRMAFNLAAAHRIYPNTAYLDAISGQIDHVLGLNGFARSFVTLLGGNPVKSPHHRPSVADGIPKPWPGMLIGGPHAQGAEDPQAIPGLTWEDDSENYWNNEIAINWNTALVYALVAAEATASDKSAACVPNCLPEEPDAMGGAGGGATK